jgi:hypothetical protein
MSICLLNVSFKIFTKVATNIISQIAKKVISPFQIGMAIRVRGYNFLPTGGPVPDPNLGGYGHRYFFPPVGNPSSTQNKYVFNPAQ